MRRYLAKSSFTLRNHLRPDNVSQKVSPHLVDRFERSQAYKSQAFKALMERHPIRPRLDHVVDTIFQAPEQYKMRLFRLFEVATAVAEQLDSSPRSNKKKDWDEDLRVLAEAIRATRMWEAKSSTWTSRRSRSVLLTMLLKTLLRFLITIRPFPRALQEMDY
ncbi:hypothetical protein JCM8547_008714 [Rhodosporidiobolus lusitaniae]